MASAKAGTGGGHAKTNGSPAGAGAEQSASARRPRRAARSPSAESGDEAKAQRASASERTPLNSIRPGRSRAREAREDWQAQNGAREREKPAPRGRVEADERRRPVSASGTDTSSIPDSVKDRFRQEGRGWYFPDGTRAFRDHGRRLTTRSENTVVIASLVEIAKARGWDSITISNGSSERFRQEAWKQAKLAGLAVRGYRPSEAERAALIRARDRQADESRSQELPLDHPPNDLRQTKSARDAKRDEGGSRRDEPIVGRLLDHGVDHYGFNPKADISYFARIETAHGKRVIWGADLQRAIKESLSQPQIGDAVVLQHRGSSPVTVVRRELDDKGTVLNETQVNARRNAWSIETAQFMDQRAKAADALRDPALSPKLVSQKHPELAGTLLQLKVAELAARRFGDPRDRERFVATVRSALADEVARGEPLRAVQLREARERRAPPERNAAPTR
jgi:hypothetical protein